MPLACVCACVCVHARARVCVCGCVECAWWDFVKECVLGPGLCRFLHSFVSVREVECGVVWCALCEESSEVFVRAGSE